MTPKISITDMFDAENFRTSGHALIDLLADHLQRQLSGVDPVINWKNPELEDQHWQQPLPYQAVLNADDLINKLQSNILSDNLAIHHPRNMGHQVATPLPMAALCDLVAALTNQAMAVYETGPSATMIERQVIRWLSELIGWKPTDTNHINGILTSGGAQANLTALLAARQHSAKSNVWKNGIADYKPLKILVSEHSHYSISRAAGIMGLGTDAMIKVATDIEGRMDVAKLQHLHQQSLSKGEHIIAVVATAGCTPTGSIDPLLEIGTYCNAESLWLHVDGAHGASALLSEQHRHQLDGIALADSVVWDGHKLLYMPATISAVLFKNPANSFAAFAQDASYLFQGDNHEAEEFNTSYRTLECTKRMMGLKLWAAFSLYGIEGMALLVDEAFAKARLLADKIQADQAFELLMQPQTNIVCFRYRNNELNTENLDLLQASIRKTLIESGAFHLTQVTLHDRTWLRTTLMNPMTQASDLEALLLTIKQAPSS
jgi:L-2,4-diaminobutyrate decarboxylase